MLHGDSLDLLPDAWSEGQLDNDVDHMSASSDSEVAQLEDINDQHIKSDTGTLSDCRNSLLLKCIEINDTGGQDWN
jgi:hypothetical protein